MNELGNTKEVIFDKSIELIAFRGYENVSMRDIAKAVGIKASSIYNHYTGKDRILERVYDYFEENMFASRLSEAEIREIIQTGSRREIIDGLTRVSFLTRDEKSGRRMIFITRILYARIFCDERAAKIFLKLNRSSVDFIKNALDYGVEIGRLRPFSTQGYANAFVAQYTEMGVAAFIQPDYEPVELYREREIVVWMEEVLPLVDQ